MRAPKLKGKIYVCTDFDIPYVGGYSKDGKTIYISRHFPKVFNASNGKGTNPHLYLALHEVVEKTLMDTMNYTYNGAHIIALGAEQAALNDDRFPVDEYYGFLYGWVDFCLKPENIQQVPKDLDISPYTEDGLVEVVNRIKELQKRDK